MTAVRLRGLLISNLARWSLATALFFICLLSRPCGAAEVIPASPRKHFNDYANVVSAETAAQFDQQLLQFERDTSTQVVVAVFPKMQSDSDIADYTFRVKEAWHVGQKKKDNGIVLFVFVQDHKMFIQVGYGLEGALPDATCKEIIDQQIAPRFKAGDFAGGLGAGINAILAATRGEYRGSGSANAAGGATVPDHSAPPDTTSGSGVSLFGLVIGAGAIFVFIGIVLFILHNFGGTFYQRHSRSLSIAENIYLFFLSSLMNGGSSRGSSYSGGGGGGDGGGGGGFSGGGGTGGGGGAGGSW